MEHIGAGLAALGVIGPGIGIGILGGLAATAIGRNPDAAGQIRGIAIILAAFAEGLGVLAIVVGLLAIFIKSSRSPVDVLAVATGGGPPTSSSSPPRAEALFQINLFWVIVSALNFILFFAIIWSFAFKPVSKMLADRKTRIEQGLQDAEQARRDRENAEAERVATLAEARREANDILTRAQKVAQETRDADIAATREELERMRVRAAAEIEAEKERAIADVRAEVADLALAGRRQGRRRDDDRTSASAASSRSSCAARASAGRTTDGERPMATD